MDITRATTLELVNEDKNQYSLTISKDSDRTAHRWLAVRLGSSSAYPLLVMKLR